MGQDKYYLFDASLVNLLFLCFTGDLLSRRREQHNSTLFRCDGIKGEQTGSIYTCSTHRLSIYCFYVSLVMFCLADANSIILPYFGVTELNENKTPAQCIFLLRIVPLCRDGSVGLILKTRGTRF